MDETRLYSWIEFISRLITQAGLKIANPLAEKIWDLNQLEDWIRDEFVRIFKDPQNPSKKISWLRKTGLIFISINSLRIIENLGGQEKKDLLISIVFKTLKENPEIKKFCQEKKITITYIKDRSNFFALVESSGDFLDDQKGLLEELEKIISLATNTAETGKLTDFSEKRIGDIIEKDLFFLELLKEIGDYKIIPISSTGRVIFYDLFFEILLVFMNKKTYEKDNFFEKMMEKIINASEDQLRESRSTILYRLSTSGNPLHFFTAYLIATDGEKKIIRENLELRTELERAKK